MRGARIVVCCALALATGACGNPSQPSSLTGPPAAMITGSAPATIVPTPTLTPPPTPTVVARPARDSATYVVPGAATLRLASELRDRQRVAVLTIEAGGAADACESVGPLELSVTGSRDTLTLAIGGYMHHTSQGDEMGCAAVVTPATASVDIDPNWLGEGQDRNLTVRLRGRTNTFVLRYQDWAVALRAGSTRNVTLDRYYNGCMPGRADHVQVGMYPWDVADIRAFRATDEQLRSFAASKGWAPVEEVYEGSSRHPCPDWLRVVVRDRPIPRGHDTERVGWLDTEEGRQQVMLHGLDRLEAV